MKVRQTRSPLDDMPRSRLLWTQSLVNDAMGFVRGGSSWDKSLVAQCADEVMVQAMRPRKPTKEEWFAEFSKVELARYHRFNRGAAV